mmetsp:Transcript_4004/g.16982  ORF Transcript_4004/g.16982 Transcript_4004/m.16982 type:complete len:245 (+) Transcript_4004:140-874(+)
MRAGAGISRHRRIQRVAHLLRLGQGRRGPEPHGGPHEPHAKRRRARHVHRQEPRRDVQPDPHPSAQLRSQSRPPDARRVWQDQRARRPPGHDQRGERRRLRHLPHGGEARAAHARQVPERHVRGVPVHFLPPGGHEPHVQGDLRRRHGHDGERDRQVLQARGEGDRRSEHADDGADDHTGKTREPLLRQPRFGELGVSQARHRRGRRVPKAARLRGAHLGEATRVRRGGGAVPVRAAVRGRGGG